MEYVNFLLSLQTFCRGVSAPVCFFLSLLFWDEPAMLGLYQPSPTAFHLSLIAGSVCIRIWSLNKRIFKVVLSYIQETRARFNVSLFNPLSANPTKWSNTLKPFVDSCRRIVWVCLAILWGWCLNSHIRASTFNSWSKNVFTSEYDSASVSKSGQPLSKVQPGCQLIDNTVWATYTLSPGLKSYPRYNYAPVFLN